MTDERRPELEGPLGPPPVEPLSDVAWARVERGLLARMDTNPTGVQIVPAPASRRWLWIATPLVAAAAAVAIFLAVRDTSTNNNQSAFTPLPEEPTRIVSGKTPTSASFGDDAHITLEADSAIAMNRDAGQPTTQLERGAARFSVTPRANRPPFIVRAGDTTVRVIGTQFRVARSDERVAVEVERGVIEVQFRGTIVSVREHQTWTSDRPTEVATMTKTALVEPKQAAIDEIDIAPEAPGSIEPFGSNVEPKVPAKRPTRPAVKQPVQKDSKDPIVAPDPVTKPDPKPTKDPDLTKYNELQSFERRDPQKAIAGYLELSKRGGKWAPIGLYAAGRLAADVGDVRAETLLTIYLRRFPNMPNVKDVRLQLDRLKGAPK